MNDLLAAAIIVHAFVVSRGNCPIDSKDMDLYALYAADTVKRIQKELGS
jgi:hypothetical protein